MNKRFRLAGVVLLIVAWLPSMADAGALIDYPLNGTPAATDQLLMLDDPLGTWATNRVSISVLWDLLRVAPGAIGGTTPAAGTFTSVTIAKSTGVAGTNLLYEANSTDTNGVGWQGPASRTSDLYLTFADANPTAGQIMTFGAPTGAGPYYSAVSWTSTSANGLSILGASYATTQGYLSVDDLITLSGVAEGSTHLGTFTGTTITDNQTVKAALQLLETAVEGAGGHAAVTLDADAAVLMDLSTQEIGLDTQSANYVFAGPATGEANEPTFRLLVDADIPAALTISGGTISNSSITGNVTGVPSTDPGITMEDSSAAAGTAFLYGNSSGGAYDVVMSLGVEDSTGEGTEYIQLDGVNETVDIQKPMVVTGNMSATTYGSDGSVTNAELLYINTLTSNAQTQITTNAALVDTDDEIIAIINASPSTQIGVPAGGMGAGTFTDGGVLLGSGTGAVTAMSVLADGEMIVGDGTTDPVAESGATLRTSIGVGTGDSPQLTAVNLGHATENTLTASGGVLSIEGAVLATAAGSQTGVHATPSTTNPLAPTWTTSMHTVWYGATGEIDLPAASTYAGRGILIYNTAAYTITIDPNGSEVIVRDGTVQTGGVTMTLSSGAGNYVALFCDGARWVTLGYKGTLAAGS